jgi:hypothetical protein
VSRLDDIYEDYEIVQKMREDLVRCRPDPELEEPGSEVPGERNSSPASGRSV